MTEFTASILRTRSNRIPLLSICCLVLFTGISNGQVNESQWQPPSETATAKELDGQTKMFNMLLDRVIEDPADAESWRLLGRVEKRRGNLLKAVDAVTQAIQLDPLNAAAHFDFAELMQMANLSEPASEHRRKVFAIAPDSQYASELLAKGFRPDAAEVVRLSAKISDRWSNNLVVIPTTEPNIVGEKVSQVDYQIQRFDGRDQLDRNVQERIEFAPSVDLHVKPLHLFLETGALYNTNISLTPISREINRSTAASAQFYASPEIEWTMRRDDDWRYGSVFKGHFTVNEGQWSAFNLASFQPGAFWEKQLNGFESNVTARADYSYALDIVDGNRLGDRHAIMGSIVQILPDFNANYAYLSVAFSQFNDDGSDPTVTSLDGTRLTTGVTRFCRTQWERMPTWIVGIDLDYAPTEGSNFRYRGLTTHTSSTIQLTPRLSFMPDAGIGGRSYYDFAGPVSRDEFTWRVGGKLVWQQTERFRISLVAGHNRFASENDDFDSERSLVGITTTLIH